MIHISVLSQEVIDALALHPGDNIIDGTLGEAGHACLILSHTAPQGFLLGLDRDNEQLERAKEQLHPYQGRYTLIQESFGNLAALLREHQELTDYAWQGILLDLGWSQAQMEVAARGFTFSKDEPLDMRYNTSEKLTAAQIVSTYTEEQLVQLLFIYGQERFARRIARNIVEQRKKEHINRTFQLVDIITIATPSWYHHTRIHPATKTFQALRIAVNNEYQELEKGLMQGMEVLAPKGRLVVITFHSGEDRIVKHTFLSFQKNEKGIVLTKKPIIPSKEEIGKNFRARSAKLRIFQKA